MAQDVFIITTIQQYLYSFMSLKCSRDCKVSKQRGRLLFIVYFLNILYYEHTMNLKNIEKKFCFITQSELARPASQAAHPGSIYPYMRLLVIIGPSNFR